MKAGWEVKALSEITTKIGSGATPRGGQAAYKTEGISLIRSLNVHDLWFKAKNLAFIDDEQAEALSNVVVQSGDVLLNITGASIARCCIVPDEKLPARVNQHVSILRPNASVVSPKFLSYLLTSKEQKDKLLGIGDDAGSTRQALTKSHLQSYTIPLPPLEEQKRIVAVLDAAFEGLTRARTHVETNLQNARELFESALLRIFGKLADPDDQKLLKEVSKVFGRGKSKHRPRNDKSLYGGSIPFIQTGDVRNSGHLIEKYSQTYSEKGLAQSMLWPAGTVCITIAANIAETGVLAFDACFPDSIIGMVPDETKTQSKYVEYLLQFFQKRLKALGEGAAQDNINLKTFETEYFPFPDLFDQENAVNKLDEVSRQKMILEVNYRQKLQDLDDLRQSLLARAFAGELT